MTIIIGGIDFDEKIIKALKEDKLVIFAGAGVSMGEPSNLMNFKDLVKEIAYGTGVAIQTPYDKLLGMLKKNGTEVHKITRKLLTQNNPLPNDLHKDLLRLFGTLDKIKIVTTNFDHLFENASIELFDKTPNIYHVSALPLGRDFNGIVHIHGSINNEQNMILTDSDFGKAYITEGWARRFLVDVFQNYTVLFVGYSHDDLVLSYLARALTPENTESRFALSECDGNWDFLGIKRIAFETTPENPNYFSQLYEGISKLAEYSNRSVLEWENRIKELCSDLPPSNEEISHEIEHYFKNLKYPNNFFEVADDISWIEWLKNRNFLKALFKTRELSNLERRICYWLTEKFLEKHSEYLLDLIAEQNTKINQEFLMRIIIKLGLIKEIDPYYFVLWINLSLSNSPPTNDPKCYKELMKKCIEIKQFDLVSNIFVYMTKPEIKLRKSISFEIEGEYIKPSTTQLETNDLFYYYSLKSIQEELLMPNIDLLHQNLMIKCVAQLENIHQILDFDKQKFDSISIHRSAIVPHPQDDNKENYDLLIDLIRDILKYYSTNKIEKFNAWVDIFQDSDFPTFRRLVINAIVDAQDKTPDEKISWLLEHCDILGFHEHHEIYDLLRITFASATNPICEKVINTTINYRSTSTQNLSETEIKERNDSIIFDMLSWLSEIKTNYKPIQEALNYYKKEYPDWLPKDHPEFTHYHRSVHTKSPLSVKELLQKTPGEQIQFLIEFRDDIFNNVSRWSLRQEIGKACRKDINWSLNLAKVLLEENHYTSDLWYPLFYAWKEGALNEKEHLIILDLTNKEKLIVEQSDLVSDLLNTLVKQEHRNNSNTLLTKMEEIAKNLWTKIEEEPFTENGYDQISYKTSFILTEFWTTALKITMKKENVETIPEKYSSVLTDILSDNTSKGLYGRAALITEIYFFCFKDKKWSQTNLIPLFKSDNDKITKETWSAYLRLSDTHSLINKALLPSFRKLHHKLAIFSDEIREHFIQYYADILFFDISNPFKKLIPEIFEFWANKDILEFTGYIGKIFDDLTDSDKQKYWEQFLKPYLELRIYGKPVGLIEGEVRSILNFAVSLENQFPEFVSLAVQLPRQNLDDLYYYNDFVEKNFVTKYPNELTQFIIYLDKCNYNLNSAFYDLDELFKTLNPKITDLKERFKVIMLKYHVK